MVATMVVTVITRTVMMSEVFILQMKSTDVVVVVVVGLLFCLCVPLGVVWLLLPSWLKMNQ